MTRIETFEPREWYDAIEALGQLHKAEVEADLHDLPCVLNREMYDTMHAYGALVCVGVFDGSNIVGYGIATVSPHPHYQLIQANHDSLFIHPRYRTPRVALRLIEAVEQACKAKGAAFIAWHAKQGSPFEQVMRKRAKPEETVYIKEL